MKKLLLLVALLTGLADGFSPVEAAPSATTTTAKSPNRMERTRRRLRRQAALRIRRNKRFNHA